jgi:two-component system NtrC family sensor kinase
MRLSKKILLGASITIVLANLVIVHLVGWQYERELQAELTESARSFYRLVVVVRAWVAHNDGVYVLKREGVEENPFLDAPTVATVDGDTLVWRNPAMVTRELSELGDAMDKRVRFHITSLAPMNPENEPTEFEREALERLEAAPPGPALEEFTRFEEVDGVEQFRYFAPLMTEQACLYCHTESSIGDVRGGISIIMPMEGSWAATDGYLLTLLGALVASAAVSLLLFWSLRRSVVLPLHRIEKAAAEIGRGNYETELLTDSEDEIGDVGRAMARMQEAIRLSLAKQVEAEKMFALGQLSAGIAHEIRNPLFAVRNDLDYLRRNDPGGDREEVYREMEYGIERIGDTVNAVLGYARSHPLEHREADLASVLEPVRALLDKALAKHGVEVDIDLGALPGIEMDVHQMEQVFMNLLTNAMRAVVSGHGRIRVTGRPVDEDHVEVEVTDNGTGIDPVDLSRIFDPFFTRADDGTGLGLTIVRRIVEQHHGAIRVDSRPGRGTTFTLRLPTRQPKPVLT